VLDPAPRFFEGDVLIDDRLYLGDAVLANEDPRLADITEALEGGAAAQDLLDLGVTRVLVQKDNGVEEGDVPPGRLLHDGRRLQLVELEGDAGSATYPAPPRGVVLAADALALLGVALAVAGVIRRRVYGALAHDSGRGST
jgi:hypothetical protein